MNRHPDALAATLDDLALPRPRAASRPLIGRTGGLVLLLILWPAAGLALGAVWAVRAGLRRARAATLAVLLSLALLAPVAAPRIGDDGLAVARALLLAPFTAPALAWGVAHGGEVHFHGSMFVVTGMTSGFGPRAGVTVGQVFLTPKQAVTDRLLAHEARHGDQWAVLGVVLPLLYTANELLTGGSADANVFEVSAGLDDGGYTT